MKLNVYRGCTWREKREVLNVFWRTNVEASSNVVDAAVQYGYYCVICFFVVMAELALIIAVGLTTTRSSLDSPRRVNSS